MNIEHPGKMLALRGQLLSIEENRLTGRNGCMIEELDNYLSSALNKDCAVAEFNLLSEMLRREEHRLAGAKTASQNEMRSLFQKLL